MLGQLLQIGLIIAVGIWFYKKMSYVIEQYEDNERLAIEVMKPDCGRYSPIDNENHHVWPWHAIIFHKKILEGHGTFWVRSCGGTVISEKYIVTHLQCIPDNSRYWNDYRLVVGKFDDDWETMGEHEQRLTIANVSSNHVRYSLEALLAISLIKVAENSTIKFGYFVRPVCMSLNIPSEANKLVTNALGIVPVYAPPSSGQVGKQKYAVISNHRCSYIYGNKRGWSKLGSGAFCGRSINSTQEEVFKLCNHDIGSGVAFAENYKDEIRYFFRGVFTATVHTKPCDVDVTFLYLTTYENKKLLLIKNEWYH